MRGTFSTGFCLSSLIEGKSPVAEGNPEGNRACNTPETAMVLGTPLPDMLMRTVAERRIWGHLAVAEFEVATLCDIEGYWTTPSQDPLALAIAHWVNLTMAATAPIVRLASSEIHVGREDTGVGRHAGRPVSTLFIRSWLTKINSFLSREVRRIVHSLYSSLMLSWSENNRFVKHDITFVRFELASSWTNIQWKGDC